jgi:zinc transporter ZupT
LFFSWVSPLGFILSLSGLISGIVGWVLAGRSQGRGYRLAVGGTVLSAFALGLNFFLTAGGFVRWVHQMFLP